MANTLQDLEVNELSSNIPRRSNKKIRKRKQLDSLLKFRPVKKRSDDILRSSEDELFLPEQKLSISRHTSRHSSFCKYSQRILTILTLCTFLSICIGLIYANIQLKSNVQDLSVRISAMEKRYSKADLSNALITIEQLKNRLNMLEHWNLSLISNQLQKLQLNMLLNEKDTFPSKSRDLEKREMLDANEHILNWNDEINSLRNQPQTVNHTAQFQILIKNFDDLSSFVYISSNRTTKILTDLGLNLDKLRNKLDDCQCTSNSSLNSTTNVNDKQNDGELMSVKRRQLFVGVLDNKFWTNEKLRAYFIKHGTMNDNQYILDCQVMSYKEARFAGKSFAFIEFNDKACVDLCMSKRSQFYDEYGITIKRLLPDSITKCQRLISSPEIVIRLSSPDSLFTDGNLRSYFGTYGTIRDLKILEEEGTAGICFITFDDVDSSDRVLLDVPHYLNEKLLLIDKYSAPEHVCSLSQYTHIDKKDAYRVRRWYSIFRNLSDFIRPITVLYKTRYALTKYQFGEQICASRENLNAKRESLVEVENAHNDVKQNCNQLRKVNENLRQQIADIQEKNEKMKANYEYQIEEQQRKNQELQNAISYLQDNSL
ncbi:unnamed protein product [Adineta ricciae]|uniref:RRM domain-containing protein n=1 Tax=Adineta ricciae TaxID=249248 RepID=A0A814ZNV0_ADIRI|nr:unnamed protein product [Adineta ricciae]CAF1245465.1 unnamed protein product [Adineta ricciae]